MYHNVPVKKRRPSSSHPSHKIQAEEWSIAVYITAVYGLLSAAIYLTAGVAALFFGGRFDMGLVVLVLEMKGVWSSVSRLNSSEDGEWRVGAVDASWYLGHGPWLVRGTHDAEMMGTAPSAISSTPSQQ